MYLCVYFQVHVCMYISLEYMYVYGYVRACVSMDIQCVCRRMSCLYIYKRMCFFVLILALCKSFLTYKRCMGMRLSTKKQKTKTKTKNKNKQTKNRQEVTQTRSTMEQICLLVGCLTSQQRASVSQGRICSDNFMCCHTEIEVADQTFHLTQSQYTDTRPTSPSTDPITPGAWQGIHWSANFWVTGMTRPRKNLGASGIRTRGLLLSRRTP